MSCRQLHLLHLELCWLASDSVQQIVSGLCDLGVLKLFHSQFPVVHILFQALHFLTLPRSRHPS